MYAKIFLKIFDSSIAEDWQARIVFQDILILANRDGMVDMTHEAISRRTNVPLEIVRSSIAKLEAPDPKSNTPEDDGRRLERLAEHKDWGWRIVNYEKYRAIRNTDEMRAATRERVAAWRAKKKASLTGAPETPPPPATPPAGEDPDGKKKVKPEKPGAMAVILRPFKEDLLTPRMVEKWQVWRTVRGAMKKPKDWKVMFEGQMEFLERYTEPVAFEILSASIRNGWQGLFAPKEGAAMPGANGATTMNPMNIKTIIQAKQTKAAELRTRYCSDTAIDAIWSDAGKRKEFFDLKKEIKNLNDQLSNMA